MPERVNSEWARVLLLNGTEVEQGLAGDLLDARTVNEQLSQGLSAMKTVRDVAERERDEARPVLKAARRLNAGRFADWPNEHLAEALAWALKWGPPEWEAEVSIAIAIREFDAARAATKDGQRRINERRFPSIGDPA